GGAAEGPGHGGRVGQALLGDVGGGPQEGGPVLVRLGGKGGHDHHHGGGGGVPDEGQSLHSRHVGHEQVEEDGVGLQLAGQAHGVEPVGRLPDHLEVVVHLQLHAGEKPDVGLVVN